MVMLHSHEEKKSPFFCAPVQRQRWGDKQVLPHVNWGDLFFDLFYVAAAFNLAAILKTNPSLEGVLYFFGCFGPVYINFWMSKMMYDARFQTPDDTVHRMLEILQLCALATAVLHIRPVAFMSKSADNPEMFLFAISVFTGSLISLLLNIEIKFIWVVGEPAARHAAGTDLKRSLPFCCLHGAAAAYAGALYYGNGTYGNVYHGPIIIMLVGWLVRPITMYLQFVTFGTSDFKKYSVPLNIDFAIHRLGEWTMLMLGESTLSLLIVNDVSTKYEEEFYITFYAGIISVTLLQYLYFKSQPHHADGHAMRRTRGAGVSYGFFLQIYSASLITVGASYKMLLTEYTSEYADYKEEGGYDYGNKDGHDGANHRLLAGGDGPTYELDDRRQRIANLFCCGLAATFISLDLMTIAHNGMESLQTRCYGEGSSRMKVKVMGIMLVVVSRLAITAFIVTLSQYVTEPEYVALTGLGTIAMQITVRFLGKIYFPNESLRHDDHGGKVEIVMGHEEDRWPNVTEPMSIPAKEEFLDNKSV